MTTPEPIPATGYIFKLWNLKGYRATAYAYMKRENVKVIQNVNGKTYTLKQIEDALIK